MATLKVQALNGYHVPQLQKFTDGAVGIDLFCAASAIIMPGGKIDIPCGICIEIPKNYFGRISPRSSAFMLGLDVREGTIDQDFRGELYIGVRNFSHQTINISSGDRIAQLLIIKYDPIRIKYVNKLSSTNRGGGSFGSTDKIKSNTCKFMTKEFLQKIYVDQGLSIFEISKRWKVSQTALIKRLKEVNIKSLKLWERHSPKLNELQNMLIVGSIFGNGKIKHNKLDSDAKCKFCHGPNEIDYLRYKKAILAKFVSDDISAEYDKENHTAIFSFETIIHPIFTKFHQLYCKNKISIDKLLNELNPFSLSIWFMDSGYIEKRGFNHKIVLDLSFFTKKDFKIKISNWMNKNKYEHEPSTNELLVLNSIGTQRFVDDIGSHIIPCMRYKLK